MMTTVVAASNTSEISFFGSCPCGWDSLTLDQKSSCIGIVQLDRIDGNTVWSVAGELRDQWNSVGFYDYQAVINSHRSCRKIYSPELRLLSTLPDQSTATPFVIITSTREKVGKETIARLKQHPRLSRFGFSYVLRLTNLIITTAIEDKQASEPRNSITHQTFGALPQMKSLCGAKIAVYSGPVNFRSAQRKIATVGAVLELRRKYYALTVAHVFFEGIDTNKSWLDSGLSLGSQKFCSNGISSRPLPDDVQPDISQSYTVLIESLWPHTSELQSGSEISRWAIGQVSPELTGQRKTTEIAALPEVILNFQQDWALIELRDPSLWRPNSLVVPGRSQLPVILPEHDIRPPDSEVRIATGVSGEVRGRGLGTLGGIRFPWLSTDLPTWSVECAIVVGDSGSLAIDSSSGLVYGMAVAHDPSITTTYIIPITTLLRGITRKFSATPNLPTKPPDTLDGQALVDLSCQTYSDVTTKVHAKTVDPVYILFLSKLNSFTIRSSTGQKWVKKLSLLDWLLQETDEKFTHFELLFKLAHTSALNSSIKVEEVLQQDEPSLLVFCLLFELSYGHLIHLFWENGLVDSRLPFSKNLLNSITMRSLDDFGERSAFISQVFIAQWKYCPVILDLNMSLNLSPCPVLPIVQRQRVNSKGATAQLWEILVAADCVGVQLQTAASSALLSHESNEYGQSYHFALKEFAHRDKSLFQQERKILRLVQNNTNFIQCFGDFTISSNEKITHNILLEFAVSDLREHFATTSPPSSPSDIHAFWENMLKIVQAICVLHALDFNEAGQDEVFRGWHGDIKPDNILIVDGNFKLSDFGLTTFGRMDTEQDSGHVATLLYGPPEAVSSRIRTIAAGQATDIWSLGCVFSEAAVWLVTGYSGLRQYATERALALQPRLQAPLIQEEGTDQDIPSPVPCFHNRENLLPIVVEKHQDVGGKVRVRDTVTKSILKLVNAEMLVVNPKSRSTAKELHTRLSGLLAEYHMRIAMDDFDILPDHLGLLLFSAPQIDPAFFTGRSRELDRMVQVFQTDERVVEQRRLVLGGMGGIGKTQLALAYVRQCHRNYTSVLWLNATSESTLLTSFRSVAQALITPRELRRLDNDQTIARVHEWLSRPQNSRWLLIFDNYDQPDLFDINTFCPYVGHGSIIITTRLPDLFVGQQIRVQPLQDIDDGVNILKVRSGRGNVENDIGARLLVERLGGLPLALVTAGAYLRKTTLTFQQYLEAYEQRWQIDRRRPVQLLEYRDRTLYMTWNLSYNQLKDDDPDAAQMLKLLAYFDNQEMWFELFHAGLSDHSPSWLQASLQEQTTFESLMSTLVSYCLVEVQHTTKSYSMHTTVHDWTLGQLNSNTDSQLYRYAFDCVAASINQHDRGELGGVKFKRLSRHGARLTHHRFDECGLLSEALSEHLDDAMWIAEMLRKQIQLHAAERIYVRILDETQKRLGPTDFSTLSAINSLGLLYRDQGYFEKAEKMYELALEGQQKVFGPEHPSTLNTVNNLGVLLTNQGKFTEAERMLQWALVGHEKVFGREHPSTIDTVNNLSFLYFNQGKVDSAEQMGLRALAVAEEVLGPNHLLTLHIVNNLGLLCINQSKFEHGEQMLQRALFGNEIALGPNHPDTLDIADNIAVLYTNQDKLDEAEQMCVRALMGFQKQLGQEHPSTRRAVANLAEIHRRQNKT